MAITPTQTRTRTRPTAAPQAAAPAREGWMHGGQQAATQVEDNRIAAEERRNRPMVPFRYKLSYKQGDRFPNEGEIVILDDQVMGACMYEHDLTWERSLAKVKGGRFEACFQTVGEACPFCSTFHDKPPYYVMFLTVIDLNAHEHDGKIYRNQPRLLPVKNAQIPAFQRYYERHGTLRGVQLYMKRDNDKDPVIGRPEWIAKHSEEDILAAFGHPAVMSTRDPTKEVKAANADCYPVDYAAIFQAPDLERVRRSYLTIVIDDTPLPGSVAANTAAQVDTAADTAADTTEARSAGPATAAPTGIAATRTRSRAPAPDPADGGDYADLDAEIPFSRMPEEVLNYKVQSQLDMPPALI